MRWPTSRTSDIGLASETPARLSAPFCCSVAASAKRNAAMSASAAAIEGQLKPRFRCVEGGNARIDLECG